MNVDVYTNLTMSERGVYRTALRSKPSPAPLKAKPCTSSHSSHYEHGFHAAQKKVKNAPPSKRAVQRRGRPPPPGAHLGFGKCTPISFAPSMTRSRLDWSASGQHRPSPIPHWAGQPSTPAYGPCMVNFSP